MFDVVWLGQGFLLTMLLLYYYMIFAFGDCVFERKSKSRLLRALMLLGDTVLTFLLATATTTVLCYLAGYLLLIVGYRLCYRDSLKRIFCVISASVMHLMVLRAICTSSIALLAGLSLYDTANRMLMVYYSTGLTFLLADIAILCVLKYITPSNIKIISDHAEQLNYLTAWMAIFNGYLIFNGEVYASTDYARLLNLNQLVAPLIILAGLYIVLFFALKNVSLLGYREKNRALVVEIGEEKRKQLEWQDKAQRDSLTNLYNKGVIGQLIGDYLAANPCSYNALFIADIDNFKNINDGFGHTFGDVVLCEISERLRQIIRPTDLVGRVGGDEFIVFVKNIRDSQLIMNRGNEISKIFQGSYQSSDRTSCLVSGSVGVAISPLYGTTFEELYRNADIALYSSKSLGKNRATLYSGEAFLGYEANRTQIDNASQFQQKNFKGNRVEYVFRILYGSKNPIASINSVLELIGRHFDFSRAYIFEACQEEQYIASTFEWCASGITPEMAHLQRVPKENFGQALSRFETTGMNIVTDVSRLPQSEQDILVPQGIKSMMQFAYFSDKKLMRIIGFDDCVQRRTPTEAELSDLTLICNILSSFIGRIRSEAQEKTTQKLLNHLLVRYHLDRQELANTIENTETPEVY